MWVLCNCGCIGSAGDFTAIGVGLLKKTAKILSSGIASVVLGLGVTFAAAVPASAANIVDCGSRDYLWYAFTNGSATCIANAGTLPGTGFAYVTSVSSGNNDVEIVYRTQDGTTIDFYLPRWQSSNFGGSWVYIDRTTIL